ncbi:MAG: DUF4194 domain-containing protein [Pseudomonadota bacterium]
MSNIFDDIAGASGADAGEPGAAAGEDRHSGEQANAALTPRNIKQVTQELLKFGLLEADRKPALYQTLTTHLSGVNAALEPLDLTVRLDDVRGLAYVSVVSDPFAAATDDDAPHPLVRRQRLTLEQSLLVAILRQAYLAHEQEAGIGAGQAVTTVDDLIAQFELFLGSSGSEARDQKRIRNLLENIRAHGVVSEIDEKDQVTIRPLITHLANPESLQALLNDFRAAGESTP